MTKLDRQGNVFLLIILSIAFFLSTILLAQLLNDKYLRGADAYHYASQALSWFNTGEVRNPESNIVHRITGILQYFGINAETALKLWTAVSYFFFLAAFVLLLKNFKSKFFAVLIFAWAALSPSILFMCMELPKTFLFMVCFNLAFYFLKNEESSPPCQSAGFMKYKQKFLLAVFLFLCLLIHKMTLLYIGVICLYLFIRNRSYKSTDIKKIIIALPVVLLIAAVYKYLIIDHFQIEDIFRFQLINFKPGVISLFLNNVISPALKTEFVIAAILSGFLFYYGSQTQTLPANKTKESDFKTLIIPILLILTAFIPAMGNETLSPGERFGLLFSYLFVLSAVYLLERASYENRILKNSKLFFIYSVIIIAGFFHLNYSYPQKQRVKIYEEYEKLISRMYGKTINMLIAHKSFNYYYKYKTGNEAFSYEPEKHWDKKRIWRLMYGATPEEIFFYLPEYCSWDSDYILQFTGSHYTLIREDCYFDMRNSVREEQNAELYNTLWNNEINPSIPRPTFFYKKHKEDKSSEFPAMPDS